MGGPKKAVIAALLHAFGQGDRFHGTGWYWLYALLALVGLAVVLFGVRAGRQDR